MLVLFKIEIFLYYNYYYATIMATINKVNVVNDVNDVNDVKVLVSPDPCELPMPPLSWLAKDPFMVLLDAATEEALVYYWADRVKACQYAIFHIC